MRGHDLALMLEFVTRARKKAPVLSLVRGTALTRPSQPKWRKAPRKLTRSVGASPSQARPGSGPTRPQMRPEIPGETGVPAPPRRRQASS